MDFPQPNGLAQNVIAMKADILEYAKPCSGEPIADVETRVRDILHERACVDTSRVPPIALRIVDRDIEGLFRP